MSSLYDQFTNWASTLFISDEDIQTHKDVAAAQQAIIDRQASEGTIGLLDYLSLSNDVQAAGNYTANYVDDNKSFLKVIWAALGKIPIWGWVIIGGVIFWYVGGFGWLKGRLNK